MGRVNKDLLGTIYKAADLFIMPNQHIEGDFEGFGIVALEASLNKTPVIAFGVDGITDAVINYENGILIEENKDSKFIDVVIDLLRDDDKRMRLGDRAREFVAAKYNWDIINTQINELLNNIYNSERVNIILNDIVPEYKNGHKILKHVDENVLS